MKKLDFCRWVDYMGNVHGRVEPMNGSSQALLIGSHLVIHHSVYHFLVTCFVILNEMIMLALDLSFV